MASGNSIAPHEALEIHELLTFKNVCATKSAAMSGLVKDQQLKQLLQDDVNTAQGHIVELQSLMQCSCWNQGQSQSQGQTQSQAQSSMGASTVGVGGSGASSVGATSGTRTY